MLQSSDQYRCIGKGFCGGIWTLGSCQDNDERQIVMKREDSRPGRSVTNDYNTHLQLLQSALQQPPSMTLSISRYHKLSHNRAPQLRVWSLPAWINWKECLRV
ncbi:uncharacterized protein M421DRAFT_427032 [Didymella exigua CBS 183.55]|uniref:Uncharacterized protein n=1 Tax=Didymella exigua CBS 183.55 TaxID=1150837 RepID=A0A6A5R574_9PLEO|nr:uncharacterized protein M421DRAFT_427032 [Didymella exigua CBS 183.55]KAF1922330.1 hypothetical protein M421DRAFT_427032 [Didymella exigua CBS 183.55]